MRWRGGEGKNIFNYIYIFFFLSLKYLVCIIVPQRRGGREVRGDGSGGG